MCLYAHVQLGLGYRTNANASKNLVDTDLRFGPGAALYIGALITGQQYSYSPVCGCWLYFNREICFALEAIYTAGHAKIALNCCCSAG